MEGVEVSVERWLVSRATPATMAARFDEARMTRLVTLSPRNWRCIEW